MTISIFVNTLTGAKHRRHGPQHRHPANGDSFVLGAQHLSYDGWMWQKTNSGDWNMVREHLVGPARRGGDVAVRARGPGSRVAPMRSSHNRHSVAVKTTGPTTSSRTRRNWVRPQKGYCYEC
jgi:hypothetical protein